MLLKLPLDNKQPTNDLAWLKEQLRYCYCLKVLIRAQVTLTRVSKNMFDVLLQLFLYLVSQKENCSLLAYKIVFANLPQLNCITKRFSRKIFRKTQITPKKQHKCKLIR